MEQKTCLFCWKDLPFRFSWLAFISTVEIYMHVQPVFAYSFYSQPWCIYLDFGVIHWNWKIIAQECWNCKEINMAIFSNGNKFDQGRFWSRARWPFPNYKQASANQQSNDIICNFQQASSTSLTSMKTTSFESTKSLENVYPTHYEALKTTKHHMGPTLKMLNHTNRSILKAFPYRSLGLYPQQITHHQHKSCLNIFQSNYYDCLHGWIGEYSENCNTRNANKYLLNPRWSTNNW